MKSSREFSWEVIVRLEIFFENTSIPQFEIELRCVGYCQTQSWTWVQWSEELFLNKKSITEQKKTNFISRRLCDNCNFESASKTKTCHYQKRNPKRLDDVMNVDFRLKRSWIKEEKTFGRPEDFPRKHFLGNFKTIWKSRYNNGELQEQKNENFFCLKLQFKNAGQTFDRKLQWREVTVVYFEV